MASSSKRDGFLPYPEERGTATGRETDFETELDAIDGGRRKRRKREANVYDAVAGRVTTTLPLAGGGDSGTERPPLSYAARSLKRDPTLAPEDVLFRRIGAPVRYAEKDIYHTAVAALRDGRGRDEVRLPDSDMLTAIHSYASHFYGALAVASARKRRGRRGGRGGGGGGEEARNVDEQSMDETALLALGILLEEAGREVLGKKGDLVFTEGVEIMVPPPTAAGAGEGVPVAGDGSEIVDFKASMSERWQSRPRRKRNPEAKK